LFKLIFFWDFVLHQCIEYFIGFNANLDRDPTFYLSADPDPEIQTILGHIQKSKPMRCGSMRIADPDCGSDLHCCNPSLNTKMDDKLLIFSLYFTGPRPGQYLTHRDVPDKEGRGTDLADITYSVLEEYDSVESLDAVLMDNTAVNTGFAGGLCACLEKKLGRKLHLIGCFLHINELPLRKIIKELDGPTKSANKFSGEIGQQLDEVDLYRTDPVEFEPIPLAFGRPDPSDIEGLSDDQRLLLEYMFGIGGGTVDEKYVKRKPGPVNHSRWLTTATRILIIYTRTLSPSENLKVIVTFIVKSYAPIWFTVRVQNNFLLGPTVLFEMIQAVKAAEKYVSTFITPELTLMDKVFPVLARNAFCCLGENFLASLLFSDHEALRQV
jgi:hypothetical protein